MDERQKLALQCSASSNIAAPESGANLHSFTRQHIRENRNDATATHRKDGDDLIVIAAGYSGLMEKFIHSNPGLESRFNKYFYFEDYTGPQLMEIFQSMCQKNGYVLSPEAAQWAEQDFLSLYEGRDENFGNARDVRNLFEKAVSRQSDRVAQLESPTREQLMELRVEDLNETETA